MIGPQGMTTVETGIQMPRGMRVVLFDQDAEIRTRVRAALNEDPGFVLAGECQEWSRCELLLDRFVPELLIAGVTEVPAEFLENLADAEFPVLVGLSGQDDGRYACCGLYETLPAPPEPRDVCSMLGRVRREIYRRKADELCLLLQRYMARSAGAGQYLSCLRVDDDKQTQEIAIEHVLLIAADGNYIRVHTDTRTYEIRDTLTGILARLDPSRFARLHRSFVVNLSHVLSTVTKDGPAVVKLSNGMEVPVGPNYREEFENIVHTRDRLSA